MQYSLDRAIHDAKFSPDSQPALTDHQQVEILSIIGKGCRADTKDRLSRRLRMPLALFPSYGIFSRLIIADDNDRAQQCHRVPEDGRGSQGGPATHEPYPRDAGKSVPPRRYRFLGGV